jgi:hypothetical protein
MLRWLAGIAQGVALVALSVFISSIAVVYHRWNSPSGAVITVALFVVFGVAVFLVNLSLWKRAVVGLSVFATVAMSGIPHYGDYMLGKTWEGYVLLGVTFVFVIAVVVANEFRKLAGYDRKSKPAHNGSST